MLNIVSRLPGIFVFLFMFITTFLLSFLLLSCYNTADAYSGIYLTSYKFNKDQLSVVSFNGTNTNEDDLADFSIKVGYLSFCIHFEDQKSCTTFDNLKDLKNYPIISVDTGDESTKIDLIKLAKNFNGICYSYVLMVVLIITLVSLVLVFWNMVPLLPAKNWTRKILCVLSPASAVLWGIGAMLQHEATKANKSLVPIASMDLVSVVNGGRAELISWVSFGMLIFVSIGNGYVLFTDVRNKNKVSNIESKMY